VSDDLPATLKIEIAGYHFARIHTQGRAALALVDYVSVGFKSDVHTIEPRLEGQNATAEFNRPQTRTYSKVGIRGGAQLGA
jgi:hypothetical protein